MKRIVMGLLLLVLAACAKPAAPVIDGATEAAYVTSLREVREALTAPDRLRFEAALKVLQAEEFARARSRDAFALAMRQRLSGKTAAQVIDEGASLGKGLSGKAVDAVFDAKNAIGDEARTIMDAAKGQ